MKKDGKNKKLLNVDENAPPNTTADFVKNVKLVCLGLLWSALVCLCLPWSALVCLGVLWKAISGIGYGYGIGMGW